MSDGTVIAEVSAGIIINSVHAVQVNANPFPTIVAGGVLLGGLLAINEFVDPGLASALGALYLLASFLFHGEVFINVLANLAQGSSAAKHAAPSTATHVSA